MDRGVRGCLATALATGLDQLADRCVKLRRQVLLTSLQSRGENRLWLRFRKHTTIFTFCIERVGETYASL